MSWEIDNIEEEPCKCGKGKVKIIYSSDDWNRFRSYAILECEECSKKYKIVDTGYDNYKYEEIK